jgi:hypothetical protein
VRTALAVAMAATVVAPGVARAQAGTAQAQFDFGLAEMEAGRYASGCPALAESYRLDPRPGVLFTLAECENKWGRSASALTHYEAYVDVFARMRDDEKAHQRGRDKVALAQRDGLRRVVPELAIALPPSAPGGTTVMRDGVPLGAPSLGVPLPVDPGEHLVVARTPDGVLHEARLTVGPGEHRALVVDLSAVPAPPRLAPPSSLSPVVVTPPAPAASPARTWAWVAGGIGLAGLAAGALGGAVVLGDKSTIGAQCSPDRTCSPSGLTAAGQARTFGLVSDTGFAVAGAGLTASLVLVLLSPSVSVRAVQPAASLEPHGAFVGLRGPW